MWAWLPGPLNLLLLLIGVFMVLLVLIQRGKGGGLRLALPADRIKIGAVLRATELVRPITPPSTNLANCCAISRAVAGEMALTST